MLLKQLFGKRTATVGESYHFGNLMTVQRDRDSMDSLDRLPDDVCLVKDFELRYFCISLYKHI